jgi:hypothetical protein
VPPPAVPAVTASASLSSPHPAVRVLGQALREMKARSGALSLRGKDQTVIRVSPTTRDRALRILDALFKALGARGQTVVAKRPAQPGGDYALFALAGGLEIEISLKERVGRRERPPKDGERSIWREYEYAPSGELTLRLGQAVEDAHRSWSDGGGKRLEDRLGSIVLGVEEVARAQAEETRQREESWRRYKEEDREREIARMKSEHEQALGKGSGPDGGRLAGEPPDSTISRGG